MSQKKKQKKNQKNQKKMASRLAKLLANPQTSASLKRFAALVLNKRRKQK